MRNFSGFATAAGLLLAVVATPASAATIVEAGCLSVASPAGCLFSGNINGNANGKPNSYLSAQNAYNIYNDTRPLAGPDIHLKYLGDTDSNLPGQFTSTGGLSGTWALNPGYKVNFVAVKSSSNFILYQINPSSSGQWSTAGLVNKKGYQQELSHLVFFGTQTAVPEPSTWLMMVLGFAVIGGAARRKKISFAAA